MKQIVLNGKRLASEAFAQEYLFDMFEFPEYYGHDLEALYDALTDITEQTRVSIINREDMELSEYGSSLIWVFQDAADENRNLTLDWTEPECDEYE